MQMFTSVIQTFIYVLQLVDGKYYVGKTTKHPFLRLIQHQKGQGSQWTKKYRPVQLIDFYPYEDKFHVNIVTKKLMDDFGIQNVRGGSYCEIELDDGTMILLNRELNPELEIYQATVSQMFISVFELVEGKYYVEKTNKNPKERFMEHYNGQGSYWTRKYQPVKLIAILPYEDKFHVDIVTKKIMDKFGIQNVRGGSYCEIELDDKQMRLLNRELNPDSCYKCNGKGHYATKCKSEISSATVSSKNQLSPQSKSIKKSSKPKTCQRCGSSEIHQSKRCKAKAHYNGYDLSGSESNQNSSQEFIQESSQDYSSQFDMFID